MAEAHPTPSTRAIDWSRHLGQSLLSFAIVFVTAYGSILLTREDLAVAPFWPANALLLVLALRSPWSPAWRLDLLAAASVASILANYLGGTRLGLSAWFTFANGLEVVAAFLMIRYGRNSGRNDAWPVFRRLRRLLLAALVAPMISASIAALALAVSTKANFAESFFDWYVAASLGMLMILPLGVMDYRDSLKKMATAAGLRSAAILLAIVAATAFVVFSQAISPFMFSMTLAILITTYFHRSLGAASALIVVALIAVSLTAGGHGPLSLALAHDEKTRQFLLQAYLMSNSLVAVFATAVLDDRDGLRLMAERREAQARAMADAQSEILRHVAHEIRTPLNVIQGLGLMLHEREDLAPEARTMMNAIIESAAEIQTLANDILDRSRVERGALHLQPASFPVASLFEELRTEFAAAQVHTRLVFDLDCPVSVWADRLRTKQMLRNLIVNAVNYAGLYGPIRISAHPANKAGYTRLDVIDQGPGIPKNRLHEVFEPFSRLGPAAASDKSAGIGLSLVKRLAEAQHGSVGAASISFIETRFWIVLPSEPSSDALATYTQDSADIDPRSIFPD